MKILLVSSNLYSQFPACFPNGMGALSAYLERDRHVVRVLHLARKRDWKKLPGMLREFAPDIFGISVTTCETPIVEPAARAAKSWNPEVPVLVGGIHAIVAPETVFEEPLVDAVCCGEGELAFAEYLRRFEAGEDVTTTPNFMFRSEKGLIRNDKLPFIQDLDSLPFMDRSVADMQEIINANNGTINLIFTRGCPWMCTFCSNRYIRKAGTGTYARLSSVSRAMEEMSRLARDYRFRYVIFRDDTFTWDKEWAVEFLTEYARRFDYPYDLFSRVDCLDEEMMNVMADTGCKHVFLGLDSGNDYIRNEILNKEQNNDDLFRVTDYLKSRGIKPMISNIVGLPHETPEMFADTLRINQQIHENMVVFSPTCGACPKIWVFTPWPGSDLYNMCDEQGWIESRPGKRKVYRDSVLKMPQFSRKEINRQFRTFRYKVYKDNFPLYALLFLIYDSAPVQTLFEKIPMGTMGALRDIILAAMAPEWFTRSLKRFTG